MVVIPANRAVKFVVNVNRDLEASPLSRYFENVLFSHVGEECSVTLPAVAVVSDLGHNAPPSEFGYQGAGSFCVSAFYV